MKIKSKLLWNKSIERFQKVFSKYPSTPEEIAVVTAIYRRAGGVITIDKTEKVFEMMYVNKENLREDLKSFLLRWIKNPIVLGIALYFLMSQVKKFIKK